MNVDAGSLKILVKRQGLVNLASQVQPDIVVKSTVVGIEGASHPLIASAGSFFLVVITVVHFYCQNILLIAKLHEPGDVEPGRSDAILVFANRLAIEKEPSSLLQSLKLKKHFAVLRTCRKFEVLAIPANARESVPVAAAVADEVGIGIHVVPSMRCAHRVPF